MRDSELRGLILEALYNQRRKNLVNLDQELGGLPVPHSATESILRQLVKKGLVERPIQSLNGLGNARITAYGIDVVQGTTRPPLSILLHQRITAQDVQVGEGNIQNFSNRKLDIQNVSDTILDVPMDHSEASHGRPKSSFERDRARGGNVCWKNSSGSRPEQSCLGDSRPSRCHRFKPLHAAGGEPIEGKPVIS